MSGSRKKKLWYAAGLHFECQGCGQCCSGPDEGYIWVTRAEVERIADLLKVSQGQLRRQYLCRVGFRSSIIEDPVTKDCIFLETSGGKKGCRIYSVRPSQCRNWPFWPSNLVNPNTWNRAGQRCSGINRDGHHSFERIEEIKSNKKWWQQTEQTNL